MSQIKPKPHRVTDPEGRTHLAYAPTKQGAITKVQNHLNDPAKWTAELASSEDLIRAGRDGTEIIDAPESLLPDPLQTDAFPAGE